MEVPIFADSPLPVNERAPHYNGRHIVFGTGPLGIATAQALQQRGLPVVLVNRSGRTDVPLDNIAGNTAIERGEITDPASVRAITLEAAVLYSCINAPYHKWQQMLPPLMAGMITIAEDAGAPLIVSDNLYVYGADAPMPLRETTPHAALTRKGKVRIQIAEMLMAAHARGKTPGVAIARASDFYGPRVYDSVLGIGRIFQPALRGKQATALGNLEAPHTYTYIHDFARALATLGAHPAALGETWHIPSAPPIATREFLHMVFDEAHQTPHIAGVPDALLRLGGLFNPQAREMVEMLYEFQKPFVVDSGKFERAFPDAVMVTPHRDAIRETLAWARGHL